MPKITSFLLKNLKTPYASRLPHQLYLVMHSSLRTNYNRHFHVT